MERDGELAEIARLLEQTASGGSGRLLLIEGSAGVGKTALLGALAAAAADAGHAVYRARGSELERDFGFGLVRQLFARSLGALDEAEAAALLAGPASLAAPIFGLAGAGGIEAGTAESSLYGLYWMLAGLAERGPLVLAIDDAHWGDTASLRFLRYLCSRLGGLPILVALAARPHEPGVQTVLLEELAELEPATLRPALLSQAGTGALLRARLGAAAPTLEAACHEATGGNPFLVHELISELEQEPGDAASLSPQRVATMGPERIAASVAGRARRLHPHGTEVARAVAVLGDAANLGALAALAEEPIETVGSIVDGLGAAAILATGPGHRFAHPLLRAAVYDAIPAATRSLAHARAATVLAEQGADPEEVAAHLLLCEPGSAPGALAVLEAAAGRAGARGATESVVTYLRRALPEAGEGASRGGLLHRLGSAEVVLRDPAALQHLGEAAALIDDPERALDVSLGLIEVLYVAGQWDAALEAGEAAASRFGASGLPGLLELEAVRAAGLGYDPRGVADYERQLPLLLARVEGRTDEDSSRLRWVLAMLCAVRGEPRRLVLDLLGPPSTAWVVGDRARESSLVSHAVLALLTVEELDDAERLAGAMVEDGRWRGALMTIVAGLGVENSVQQLRGRLDVAEERLSAVLDLLGDNDLSMMGLAATLNFSLDTILERSALAPAADLVAGFEVPPPLDRTLWGALALEANGAVAAMRGDREGALASLRRAAEIYRPLRVSPRFSPWRSRLALALPADSRAEAVALAEEELQLALAADSARARGVALRALGLLFGGEAGAARLRESVAALRGSPARLELARSLAELGAAQRRGNRRTASRESLREAADLAERSGAERLGERVREELRVAGARPRRRALSGVESLTPAERRVAAAAAAGAGNREIAHQLFVSLRTVEMHLTNSYRKLGISSRSELAAVLSAASAPLS